MIVADSSPVIILSKCGALDIFKKCFGKLIIPASVYNEITLKHGSPEIISVENAIKAKWLVVQKTEVLPELDTQNIGQGEKESISLALNHKCILMIDDDHAKTYASIFGVEAHGTLYVLYLACLRGFIKSERAIMILENMISHGFYVSPRLYVMFIDLLKSVRRK